MPIPAGPFIVGPDAIDSVSTNGPCTYPAKPLAGTPFISPTIKYKGTPIKFYHEASVLAPVEGVQNNPLIPCVVPVAPRKIVPTRNTSVHFNKFKPAVMPGDTTTCLSTNRPIVGSPTAPTVFIASRAKP